MTPYESRLISFLEDWRKRLLARHPGHAERLSEEEFGQLVTLNTVISYVQDVMTTTPAQTINVTRQELIDSANGPGTCPHCGYASEYAAVADRRFCYKCGYHETA